jgi:hypothetical protein
MLEQYGDKCVREKLKQISEEETLLELLKDFIARIRGDLLNKQYTEEMINSLNVIIDSNISPDKLRQNCRQFFSDNSKYLSKYATWSETKKTLACIYLASEKDIEPKYVSDICYITEGYASDLRREIHNETKDYQDDNFLINYMFDKTEQKKTGRKLPK